MADSAGIGAEVLSRMLFSLFSAQALASRARASFTLLFLLTHALSIFGSTLDFHAHEHHLCPEHGEVVHGAAPHSTDQNRVGLNPKSIHEHCAMAAHFRPSSARVELPSLPTCLLNFPFALFRTLKSAEKDHSQLYSLAPKNSPPSSLV